MRRSEAFFKVSYAVIFLALLITLLAVVQNFFERYLNKDTSVSLDIAETKNAEFPSLTICPDYEVAYKRELLAEFGTNVDNMRDLIFPNLTSYNLTTGEFVDLVTFNLSEIVSKLDIRTAYKLDNSSATKVTIAEKELFDVLEAQGSKTVIHVQLDNDHWNEYFYDNFGKCFNYQIPDKYKKLGIQDVAVTIKLNALVYIHHDGQFNGPDTSTKVPGAIGALIFLDVEHGVSVAYPIDFKDEYGVERLSCSREMSKAFDSCVAKAQDQIYMERLGCISPLAHSTKDITNKSNVCQNVGGWPPEKQEKFRVLYDESINYAQTTFCIQPCETMTFTFGLPKNSTVGIGPDQGLIKLYFKSQINVRRSNLDYSILEFVADIGGYLGLLLGFSLLDITSVLKQAFVYYWQVIQARVKKDQILPIISEKKKPVEELTKSSLKINKKTYSVYTVQSYK